uniref:Putative polyprotein n=1 Tax=Leavenworthia alabamica TaxID=310722 RepID=A0A2Z4HJE9_LEAAL|nr:putative polyprotein [Leavenworthia alabamica]
MAELRRTISPYDLTSADNPGAVISHPLLRGTNYDEWSTSFRTALISRKKFGFLDGTIPKPSTDSPDYEDWMTIQALLVSWIKMTIEPSLRSTVSHRDVAQDLWDHLKKRFSVMNGSRFQALKSELACCKQRGLAIEAYFGKLNKIWDNMATHRPLRVCECGMCTCNLGAAQETDREEDKVHEFLFGLDEQYRGVRSSLVSRQTIPSLEETYNLVRQEEDMKLTVDEPAQVSAFAVQTRSRARDDKSTMICTLCNRSGHTADKCYAVIGYPDWWGDRPKGRSLPGRGRGTNNSGGGRGRSQSAVANRVSVPNMENLPKEQAQHVITDADRDGISGLSEQQWKAIKSILNAGQDITTEKMSGKSSCLSWVLDTGASHHLTGRYEVLNNVRDMPPVLIIMADGREQVARKEGSVSLGPNLIMKSVYFVEELKSDLISLGQLMDENRCVIQMADNFLVVQDRSSRMVTGAGRRVGGTYHFCSTEVASFAATEDGTLLKLWHQRMGHPSLKVVGMLSCVSSSVSSSSLNKSCDVCLRAKQTRDRFPLSMNKTSKIFDMIHVDLWGPYRTPSHCGARYFLTIVDDFSRGVWLYLLKSKTEAPQQLKNFLALTERQFDIRVKVIRSDNGSEFICLTDYFRQNGISHETSCVGTPQQNGRAERKHRHILNVARALRFQANLPIKFWGECILTAGYLINRTPTSVLGNKTPFERLFNKEPSYAHLRIFGTLCHAHNQKQGGDKFASRSRRCIFMGYPHGQKGWRLYDAENDEFFVSRDVVFSESVFPYATSMSTEFENEEDIGNVLWAPICEGMISDDIVRHGPLVSRPTDFHFGSTSAGPSSSIVGETDAPSPTTDIVAPPIPVLPPVNPPTITDISLSSIPPETRLGKGHRTKTTSVRLKDFVIPKLTRHSQSEELNLATAKEILYPIASTDDMHRFSETHIAYVAAIVSNLEPKSFRQAMEDDKWRDAVGFEYTALEDNQTWSVEDLPPGKKAIGSQWVFKVKFRSDGAVERYKARLVAMGNKQIEGEDYGETFSPVAKMGTVRLFLDVAAKKGWIVHQMDVHNAFLHGDLEEEVYMRLPPGYQLDDPNKVCRLRKSLYGLKQAPRCWFAKLSKALLEYGFEQSLGDYSLFTYDKGTTRLHILIYVDDLIIAGSSLKATESFKAYLSSCFHMKDLGELKYFLGIEVARNSSGFYLCQRKYALDIISETGLLASKPVSFPLEQNHKLAVSESALLSDPLPYRRLLGRLIYLGVTRPDLAFSVHVLAQFMQRPRLDHWFAALRVVRYLKSDPGQGILLQSTSNFQITGWCDSDWGSCPITRRSVTGYFVQFGDSPISWKTKKQKTVSRSSAEAEYRAIAALVQELIWLKRMLLTLGILHPQPMKVYCDSKSAIYIATNPVFHERTKHIELDLHFVRDEVLTRNIELTHVGTNTQLADVLTKAVGRDGFDYFRSKLGIRNLYAPA